MKFAIVVGPLLRGPGRAARRGRAAGVRRGGGGRPTSSTCPGAFELPLAAQYLAETGRYAGVACLGAVIRGETSHYDYVCAEAARGIMDVQLRTGVPCAFGVLTVENMDQALARTGGGKRDQGAHAAEAVVTLARLKARALARRRRCRGPSAASCWAFFSSALDRAVLVVEALQARCSTGIASLGRPARTSAAA